MSIDFNELRELLTTISGTDITELVLKSEAFELTVRKDATLLAPQVLVEPSATMVRAPSPSPVPSPSSPPPPQESDDEDLQEIASPMVGTFYRAPAPDEAPFVEIGDRITSSQTVCIIEAMKLMNEIEAEVSGESGRNLGRKRCAG